MSPYGSPAAARAAITDRARGFVAEHPDRQLHDVIQTLSFPTELVGDLATLDWGAECSN
jgi:hypothetical protein